MPLGYGYVERDVDSQINWAQVGAEASGMLLEVNRVREEKKDALAQAQRESLNNLMNSPQGVDQSVNGVVNKFAHDLIEQTKIDYDLLIRGDMSVRDYTLKRQNQLDGTNNLFKVAPELQKAKKTTLDGISNGSLQSAANIFQGSFVEKMVDLSNLSINVNSPTGEINFGLLEDKIIDGKTVKVMGKNIATSNVLLGMLAQPIQSFYTDKETTNMVERFGSKKAVVYQAATTAGAGTISEYLGPTYLASIKDPVVKEIANNFNKAIDDMVASRIGGPSNSYNLMGVITEDLAKYGSDDFTYNSDEAKANTNKILVKINQATHRMDLDETGANYERMKKEANDFVKNQIILKLDEEKKITTTGQLSESSYTKERAARINRAPSGETPPPPVTLKQVLVQTEKDNTGKKIPIGAISAIENLVLDEAKGVQNYIETIGYNGKKGTLYVTGYQISGKETDKSNGGDSETVVKRTKLLSSDKGDNAGLLSIAVPKLRNPEDPDGGNFQSIAQAKDYYKRVYEGKLGGTTTTATPAKKTIQFDSQGNIIQ
jgi:hypothetical protein